MTANYCTRGRGNRAAAAIVIAVADDGRRRGQRRLLPRPPDVAWPARRLVVLL